MALEHRFTKLSLHQRGKDMVTGPNRPNDPTGKPYELAYKAQDIPVIPDPSVFNFQDIPNGDSIGNPSTTDLALPDLAECATHLEFLETLFVLRQKILVSKDLDEVMQTEPRREEKTGVQGDTKTFKDENLWGRRQIKWPLYAEFATIRFLAWREGFNKSNIMEITQDNLPPLDILMVWHSFLLNPRLFYNTCSDEPLFSVRFPWNHIHEAINSDEWSFTLGPRAAAHYKNNYGEYASLFETFLTTLAGQLRDAVIRQASFVDKMNSYMWIRSPAIEGTIRRGVSRYVNFCKLIKMSKTTVVPTLDIDLVWHTHQCTAKYYGQAMKVLAGKFVNHDDTIEKPQLGDGFAETRALYRVHFGQEYRACGCWDCQALLTELERVLEKGESPDIDVIAMKVKEDVFYHRAVEWSRRHKTTLPMRRIAVP
ncbi:hypothetical protein FGSG_03198 [Fusarium graminearum PH-1]|uniref:hypothetical protein n=1 Tax=Gibberella zeae (strain ATCC MYA-4620 / CBS 123657 / FGSC 9075 / NRRL 31084 / PH-1) TaxID=229533 RepID=UPI00021F1DF5|nr:hypothetical protein FGSG_03198 [Fusarium graminearum PH-1]ESU10063.1 hypothetical protein FGSG_03198 [Fusarium graminearum PH-1]|eukprot:XP_011322562.1 hypothetical protein FGSG_03198 [Fusarium graminearum PH-1]